MREYTIRIDCGCFQDIIVKAKNEADAIELALNKFNCPANCPEFNDVLKVNPLN